MVVFRQFKKTSHVPHDIERRNKDIYFIPGMGRCELKDIGNNTLFPFVTSALKVTICQKHTNILCPIYFDSNKLPYFLGLIPGNQVCVSNLVGVTNNSKTYHRATTATRVQFFNSTIASMTDLEQSFFSLTPCVSDRPTASQMNLIDHIQKKLAGASENCQLNEVTCRVMFIRHIKARWTCALCKNNISMEQCVPGCFGVKNFRLEVE